MHKKKRIVVTGMGLASCFGNDVDIFYQQLLQGKSGVKPISTFDCENFTTRFAATIENFDAGEYLDKKQARRVDKFISYASVAAKSAIANAKALEGGINKERCGVIVGSGMGGMQVFVDNTLALNESGPRRVSPFLIPYIITNMAGALVGIDLGFMGPNYSISTACATANYCFIAAANHIRNGDADLIICGGTEAAILPIGLAGFCACKALSQRNDAPESASRPWDKQRDGFVMGEGAGALVFESLEHALARGATIYAEYLGGGVSTDAHHITEPKPDGRGVELCILNALRDANITAEEINYINAHATSTPAGDMAEVAALKKVFVNGRGEIVMNATKSMIGHCLGAAGALEAIALIKAITDGIVHPTINLETPEDGLDFNVPTKAYKHAIRAGISNSFGFGGHNASIILAPYKP